MTSLRPLFVTGVLALALLAGGAPATEPEEFYDASGRLVESVDGNGVRVQYIYNGVVKCFSCWVHGTSKKR